MSKANFARVSIFYRNRMSFAPFTLVLNSQIFTQRYWILLAIITLIANVAIFFLLFINCNFNKIRFFISKESQLQQNADNDTLLDLIDFKYLISNTKCTELDDSSLPLYIIAINSNPYAKEIRQTIRKTWGSPNQNFKAIFFLGAVQSEQIQLEIEAENKEFGDIVQGNFLYGQRNLSYSHVMILKWFVENCKMVKYLIKMNEDVFANVPVIQKFLTENLNPISFLMGLYQEIERCPRNGPWGVTHEEYASDFYPMCVAKQSIIYSSDVVAKLFYESQMTEFFWVDAVFVTGILRSKANIDIIPIDAYILTTENLDEIREELPYIPNQQIFMFSLSNLTIQDQLMLWKYTELYRLGEKGLL